MRNPDQWKPTKVALAGPAHRPVLRVPAEPGALGAGSTLIATLVARWYQAALATHARGLLLDLGCGAMPYRALYAAHVSDVIGTDWPQSLHRQPHADLFCDLNAGVPLRSELADTVLLADVLEHLYRPQALLAEVHRVLRPGGTLLLNTPFMYGVHEAPHDYYRYTPHALRRMALDAGFEPVAVDAIGGSPCVLADVAGKLLNGLPLAGPTLARALQRAILLALPPLPRSDGSPLFVAAVLRKPT